MSVDNNRLIAQETRKISRDGFYEIDGRHIELKYGLKNGCDRVIVISPDYVKDIRDKEKQFIKDNIKVAYPKCDYRIVNMDSYIAELKFGRNDRTLVMNFANARHPGGGFLNGANAQEESLCRSSSLYESLISKEASEMYEHNKKTSSPYDSDYMLISPYVDVFRSVDGKLLDESHSTAVITIAAPNRNGRAKDVGRDDLQAAMINKIKNLLLVAAAYKYDTLILGAWGCGAFGHKAKDVAGYFRSVLVDQKYSQFFKQIVFAVYDRSSSQYNYLSFTRAFDEYGVWMNTSTD